MLRFHTFLVAILLHLGVEANAQDEIYFENPKQQKQDMVQSTGNNVSVAGDGLRRAQQLILPSNSNVHYVQTLLCSGLEDVVVSKITEAPGVKCGVSNPGGVTFRFMDGFADFGEFPWMVAIIKKSNASSEEWIQKDYLSAGSIIHPSVILSAGRLVDKIKPEELKVRAGEWNVSTADELYEYQERDVRKIIVHPEYNEESLHNDVSLLFLNKPYDIESAPQIRPVCVGQSLPELGTKCFGMGWGLGSNPTITNILKKLPVTLMSREDCETSLRETGLSKVSSLYDSLICGRSSSDTYKEDEGASLVCPIKGESTRFILYGISAYRLDHNNAPYMYANAPQFYKWIGEQMSLEDYNSDTYTYQPPQ